MRDIKVIITLGPSTFSSKILKKLKKMKVSMFRINLSHTSISQLKKYIKKIKQHNLYPICIDTEGAQVRTANVKKKFLKVGEKVFLGNGLKKNNKNIILYPDIDTSKVRANTYIHVGFDGIKIKILKLNKYSICGKVVESGILETNKGVHFESEIKLNALTKKDIESIKIAKKSGIKIFALSFANNKNSINEIKKYLSLKDFLISKIESKSGFINRKQIIKNSDAILIDRGDLSRYISVPNIPCAQKIISKDSIKIGKPVYIATNLLETMIKYNLPTRAESNDIFNSLLDGASGLVLAAETAIGKNPLQSIKFLHSCILSFKKYQKNSLDLFK